MRERLSVSLRKRLLFTVVPTVALLVFFMRGTIINPPERLASLFVSALLTFLFLLLGIRFIPLGGLTPETSAEYFGSPLIAACGGSWIAPAKLIAAGDWSAIRENAAKATAIAKAARALPQKTS